METPCQPPSDSAWAACFAHSNSCRIRIRAERRAGGGAQHGTELRAGQWAQYRVELRTKHWVGRWMELWTFRASPQSGPGRTNRRYSPDRTSSMDLGESDEKSALTQTWKESFLACQCHRRIHLARLLARH